MITGRDPRGDRNTIRRHDVAPGGTRRDRIHHIESIAHHFLTTDDGTAPAPIVAPLCLDVAVVAASGLRTSACAGAGLAFTAAVRPGGAWGSCLLEDRAAHWSATSFLGRTRFEDAPHAVMSDLPPTVTVRWLRGCSDADQPPRRWLRWRVLGEASLAALDQWEIQAGLPSVAVSLPLQWACLVWCVAAGDAASGASACGLGRLVALLKPRKLEVLVVPDAWAAPLSCRDSVARVSTARADPIPLRRALSDSKVEWTNELHRFPDPPRAAVTEGTALLEKIVAGLIEDPESQLNAVAR